MPQRITSSATTCIKYNSTLSQTNNDTDIKNEEKNRNIVVEAEDHFNTLKIPVSSFN